MPRDTDPKSLGDRPHLGAPVSHSAANPEQAPVPAPTTTAPSQPLPPSGDASGSNLKAMSTAEVTAVPLFGATPPPDPAAKAADGKERIAAGSKERVASLRRAREAELERSGSNVAAAQAGPSNQQPAPPPPLITRLAHAPMQARSSTLIPYLRRLSMILSILLGAGGAIALVWSAFLLPLLHASFSARRALVEQQVDRVGSLLQRLKEVRASGVHAGMPQTESEGVNAEAPGRAEGPSGNALVKRDQGQEAKGMIREISHSSAPSTSSPTRPSSPAPPNPAPLIPDISGLVASLRGLSVARSHTSTTRTSLLSTIESYTSALHRQLWNPRPGAGMGAWGTGYGLGTLDQSLAREGGAVKGSSVYKDGWEGEGLRDRGEEWDAVRKEIRGIKGMLLGRRSMGLGA